MFTEPRVLRALQEIYDIDLKQQLVLAILPEPILLDHEIWDHLQPLSRFEEVRP